MWHIYLLPSSTAFYPVWQFQLPPGSSQSNETFWLKVQVCSLKEAFWGHSGHSGKAGGRVWSQVALDNNPGIYLLLVVYLERPHDCFAFIFSSVKWEF